MKLTYALLRKQRTHNLRYIVRTLLMKLAPGVVIDSEPNLSRTCKTSLLFAPLAVRAHTGCSDFLFYTPTKPLIRLYFKYKTVLIPNLKIVFII